MKVTTTRTLNPLPFQDLEPHRFEDLIRQLAYDLRRWKSLEATGRSGSDEGLDIRALEVVVSQDDDEDESQEEDGQGPIRRVVGERLWIFQCKREKTLAQRRVRQVVAESLASLESPPYGFVLAVACDISKKTRDAFREDMVSRGIEEFAIWARGELEDMLFQPKNDHLLFVYFGISLTTRRRTLSTSTRTIIARKKELKKLLGERGHLAGTLVLLRDPSDERYPNVPEPEDESGRWFACEAVHLLEPGYLLVLHSEYLAAITPDGQSWDAFFSLNIAEARVQDELRFKNAWGIEANLEHRESWQREFWTEYIAESDRAEFKIYRFVPLERIIAIDPLGDGHFPVPHILVDFHHDTGPFTANESVSLDASVNHGDQSRLHPAKSARVVIFPEEEPGIDDLPPAGFDDTSSHQSSLSQSVGDKLSQLLAGLEGEPSRDTSSATDSDDDEGADQKMQPFRDWLKQTALPLLSAFVSRLRAAGHFARVVVRSVPRGPSGRFAEESVELRVRMRIQTHSHYNPRYRSTGQVRVTCAEWRGWQLDVNPAPDDSNRRYSSAPRPKVERMHHEQLEAEVIGMLERLIK